jgi:hypothetical protein
MAKIVHGILTKAVLGLDGKNSSKKAQEADFQFYTKKRPKIPLLAT